MDSFLVNQSGCGNLPVQFVGTKVAFVTQITATYQLERGALELVGGRQVRGLDGERCPLVGSWGMGTGLGPLPPGLQACPGNANLPRWGTQGLGSCLALKH